MRSPAYTALGWEYERGVSSTSVLFTDFATCGERANCAIATVERFLEEGHTKYNPMRAGMYLGVFVGRRGEKLTDLLDAREVSEPRTSRTRSENHAVRRVFHVRFESKNLAARFSMSSL